MKTRGAPRQPTKKRLTASGAPKFGTTAKRQTAEKRRENKAAKAAEALKNPRTGKEQRARNKVRREAAAEEQARRDAHYAKLQEAWDKAISARKEAKELEDSESLDFFKKTCLPSLLETEIDEDSFTSLLDDMFIMDASKQRARDMLASAKKGDVDITGEHAGKIWHSMLLFATRSTGICSPSIRVGINWARGKDHYALAFPIHRSALQGAQSSIYFLRTALACLSSSPEGITGVGSKGHYSPTHSLLGRLLQGAQSYQKNCRRQLLHVLSNSHQQRAEHAGNSCSWGSCDEALCSH